MNRFVRVCSAVFAVSVFFAATQSADAAAPLNADCLGFTAPATVRPGQRFTATVLLKNTGTQTWGSDVVLLSTKGQWKNSTTQLPIKNVSTNQHVMITLVLTAPNTVGSTVTEWMMSRSGVAFGKVCRKTIAIRGLAVSSASSARSSFSFSRSSSSSSRSSVRTSSSSSFSSRASSSSSSAKTKARLDFQASYKDAVKGQVFPITFILSNAGPDTAKNVHGYMHLLYRDEFNAAGSDPRCKLSSGSDDNIVCNFGDMPLNASTEFVIALNLNRYSCPNKVTQYFYFQMDTPFVALPDDQSLMVKYDIVCPDSDKANVQFDTVYSDVIHANETKYISYNFQNEGNGIAFDLKVTVLIPPELVFTQYASCTLQGNALTCPLGALHGNDQTSFSIPFSVKNPATCQSAAVTIHSTVTTTSETLWPLHPSDVEVRVLCGDSY